MSQIVTDKVKEIPSLDTKQLVSLSNNDDSGQDPINIAESSSVSLHWKTRDEHGEKKTVLRESDTAHIVENILADVTLPGGTLIVAAGDGFTQAVTIHVSKEDGAVTMVKPVGAMRFTPASKRP